MAIDTENSDSNLADWRHRLRRALGEARWYLQQMGQQFIGHDCLASAGTLTYTSSLAVVPLMTVGFAIFSILPDFAEHQKQIADYVFANFLPSSSAALQSELQGFSDNAGNLTSISFMFLFVTAFMMLVTIEKSFNKIWQVPEPRGGLQRFLVYWAVLSLGPALIAGGMLISLYFKALPFISELDTLGIGQILLSELPKLLSVTGFTVLYFAVPNCSVPFRHAFAGGVLTMIAFEMAKWGLEQLASNLAFNVIYGSFAAVPIFLLWLYLVWIIVLAGVVFVRSLSLQRDRAPTPEPLLLKGARLLKVLGVAHQEGHGLTDAEIHAEVTLNRAEHQRLFDALREMRLLQMGEGERWVLGRSLKSLTLWDLYQHLPDDLNVERLDAVKDLPEVVAPIRAMTQFGSNEMSVTLDQLLGSV